MLRYRRGCGPVTEANTMDKCVRDITRDFSKVVKFVNGEPDQKKKDALMSLYQTAKYFVDQWDGISEEGKDRRFAKHVVILWTMLLNQPNGRKIMIVPMGGVTIPDATYYGYWCTIRGLTTAQLTAIEVYVDKMRIKAEAPSIDEASMISNNGDGNINTTTNDDETIENDANTMDETVTDVPMVAERDNVPDMGNIAIDFTNGNISIEDMVTYVAQRTRQLLMDEENERDNEVDTIEDPNRARVNSDASNVEINRNSIVADAPPAMSTPEPPIEPFQALNGESCVDNEPKGIGPIDRTMDDSGLAPPTLDSQALPAPNVTIDTLDNDDTFEDSSGWFDEAAQDLINQRQSTPSAGKLTIEIKDDGYYVTIDGHAIACKLKNVHQMLRFIRNIVKSSVNTNWVGRFTNGEWIKIVRKCYAFSPENFPNFDFEKLQNRNLKNEEWCEITPQKPINFSGPAKPNPPVRKTLREIGRSNAIDEDKPRKSPNPRNFRLHGRKGSRGQSIDHDTTPPAIEPVELGLQVLRVQQRLNNIESKLANEKNEKVLEMLHAMKD